MMQYAQWQSHPSCTFTKPRVRAAAERPSSAARPTSGSCSRSAHPPSAPAIARATSSAVPVKGRTAGSISANCAARRFTAQPPTYTSRAFCSERRTAWRDFASASPVMQHVLITCTSASASGTSSWPAASSAARASIASAWETLQPRNFTAKRMCAQGSAGEGSGSRGRLRRHVPAVQIGCRPWTIRCTRPRSRRFLLRWSG